MLLYRFEIAPEHLGPRRFPNSAVLQVKEKFQLPLSERMATDGTADHLMYELTE